MKRLLRIWLVAAGFVLYLGSPVLASTYYVNPGESIQDAIDGASYGDTIQVADGTYVELITLKNGVALIGAGASTTTIDGNDAGSVVTSITCDPNTVLSGFTITNGISGGGMHNKNSNPTVTKCTFSGNSAGSGGGMYNEGSNPAITNCTFYDNFGFNNGGGMYNQGSSPTVTNCVFS
jgi:hypothetical protein